MCLLHLTFISSISHFHIFYKHIPHKIAVHTPHISLNSTSHKVYIYKIHVQQSIYIEFLYILQTPYLTKIYIYIYIFLTISTHLKTYQTLFQELIAKSPFSWKIYIYNAKSPSYERQNTKSHSYGRQHHSYLTKK